MRDDADIIEGEGLADEVYGACDAQPMFSNGWASLQIDMSMKTEEERLKIYQAESLLNEAGIYFDTGSGDGSRDWSLDWSLSGAVLRAKPIYCMCHEHSEVFPLTYVYWQVYRSPEGRVLAYAYCTPASRGRRCAEMVAQEEYPWEAIVQDEGPVK